MTKKKKIIIGSTVGTAILIATGVVLLVTLTPEPTPTPGPNPIVETIEINEQLSKVLTAVINEQGTGNDKYLNEETRSEAVPYIIYNEIDLETGEIETYAMLYASYNYQKTFGQGEDAEVVDMLATKGFRIKLNQEQKDLVNSNSDAEVVKEAIVNAYMAEDANITYVDNPMSRAMEAEDYATLVLGIKASILNNAEYIGFTDKCIVNVTDIYKNEDDSSYDVYGMVFEGDKVEFFEFKKTFKTMDEYIEARESITDVAIGQTMEENGFVMSSPVDAKNAGTVNGIEGKYYSQKSWIISVPKLEKTEPEITK